MREGKKYLVIEVEKHLNGAAFVVLTDYTGLDVGRMNELRRRLMSVRAGLHVVKNTILELAAKKCGLPALNGSLKGPTAIVTGAGDIGAAAKILKNFAAEFERPKIKLGVFGGKVLEAAVLQALADLPPREILFGQLLGLIQTPATQVVRVLNEPASMLARVVQAKSEKQEPAAVPA